MQTFSLTRSPQGRAQGHAAQVMQLGNISPQTISMLLANAAPQPGRQPSPISPTLVHAAMGF
jgi:hypothetical protein